MRFVFVVALPWFFMTVAVASDAVPSKDAFKTAEAKVNSVYADDITAAKSPMANRKLADHLVKIAGEEKDSAVRYVVLTKAREAAIDIPDPALGYRITESIVKDFRPVDNHSPEEWLALGDELKANLTKKGKPHGLNGKLLALESYLRAYPNPTGIQKDAVKKHIEDLYVVGSPRDRNQLIGVWEAHFHGEDQLWTFERDGTVTWRAPRHHKEGQGTWTLDPTRVYIQWENSDRWEAIPRPFTTGVVVIGDGSYGTGSLKAKKR